MALDIRQPVGGPSPNPTIIELEGDESDDAVLDVGSEADDESDNLVRRLTFSRLMSFLDSYPLYQCCLFFRSAWQLLYLEGDMAPAMYLSGVLLSCLLRLCFPRRILMGQRHTTLDLRSASFFIHIIPPGHVSYGLLLLRVVRFITLRARSVRRLVWRNFLLKAVSVYGTSIDGISFESTFF